MNSRKFMVYSGKVFLLITFPLNYHHGLLHFSNFCRILSESRCSFCMFLNWLTEVPFYSAYTPRLVILQLLLHPESDDSAQLSQVITLAVWMLLLDDIWTIYELIIFNAFLTDWDRETYSSSRGNRNEQAIGKFVCNDSLGSLTSDWRVS